MSSTVAVKAFAEGVTQQIKDYLPEDYQDMECEILEQQKNNGVVLTGMILNMPDSRLPRLSIWNLFMTRSERESRWIRS